MEERIYKLRPDDDYTLTEIAKKIPTLKPIKGDINSLGPFTRVSTENNNIMYLLVYCDDILEKEDFEITEKITEEKIIKTSSSEEIIVSSYEIQVRILKANNPFSKLQTLWGISILANPNVILKNKILVNCIVDFNKDGDKFNDDVIIEERPEIVIGKPSLITPDNEPKRATKVIISIISD